MEKKQLQDLISAMLASLRGRASTAQFSQRLGFSSNQIHRWENHHGTLRWKDLITIARAAKIPLEKNFISQMTYEGDPADFKGLVEFILPSYSREKIARICGVTSQAFSKWMLGSASPPLGVVFTLVLTGSFSLGTFVSVFIPPEKQNSKLKKILQREERQRSAVLDTPWTLAVMSLINSGLYAEFSRDKLPQALHKKLGLPTELLAHTVNGLFRQGILVERNQQIIIDSDLHADLSGSEDSLREFIDFWSHFGLQTANGLKTAEKPAGRAGSMIISIAPELLPEMYSVFMRTYHELHQLSERSSGKAETRTFSYTSLLADADSVELGKVFAEHLKRWPGQS